MDNNYQTEKNSEINEEQKTNKKPPMFQHCFSFKGCIRQLEFGLSVIIFYVYAFIVTFLFAVLIVPNDGIVWLILILFIPINWFWYSQGTRRCHDFGRNGWWQLIPFFYLVMLFEDSDWGNNKYGRNPKGKGMY